MATCHAECGFVPWRVHAKDRDSTRGLSCALGRLCTGCRSRVQEARQDVHEKVGNTSCVRQAFARPGRQRRTRSLSSALESNLHVPLIRPILNEIVDRIARALHHGHMLEKGVALELDGGGRVVVYAAVKWICEVVGNGRTTRRRRPKLEMSK